MTVSLDKFYVGMSVKYGGFVLEASVDEPIKILSDPTRLQDLLDIPSPTNKKELASFLGFVNTFKTWTSPVNLHSNVLRDLSRKDTELLRTPEAESEFIRLKKDLQTMAEINPYNPSSHIQIYPDASYGGGCGFIAGQKLPGGGFNVIQVGSTSLSPSQRNYSVYELEVTGSAFAAKKCHHFLAHNPNKVKFFTDHAASSNLENIQLDTVKNSRTLRLLEDLMAYNYEVKHISVKQNAIADYLSRLLTFPGATARP